jgi:exonuclease SbcC
MKILKVKLKNIHSLKGEHTIDFAGGILGSAGLFAITGPTGSGKSSILDAITLALYNRIPRVDKAISDTVIEEEGVIITKNTNDCYAEVEYDIKGKVYRSSWSIKRAKTGTLSGRKQELVDAQTGEILSSGKSDVVKKNEEFIGLNYEQFVQSLILAQGQFAKLLLAKKDERNKLLEEITGYSYYRRIGAAIFRRFKETKEAVEKQEIIMGEIVLMKDDELKLIIADLEIKKPQLEKDNARINELAEKKITKDKIVLNLQKKKENDEEFIKHNEKKKRATVNKNSLDEHDKFVGFKDRLNKIEQNTKLESELLSKIKTINNVDLPQLVSERENLFIKTFNLLNEQVNETNFKNKLEDFRLHVTGLIEKEKESQNNAKQESQRIKDKIKALKSFQIEIPENPNIAERISDEVSKIDLLINKTGISEVDALRLRLIELNESLLPANILLSNRKLFDEKNKIIAELQSKINLANIQLQELTKQKEDSLKELELLKIPIEHAKAELEDWQKKKSLDQHRLELEDDKPCPLCGSLEHPYAKNTEEVLINKLQEKHDELIKKQELLKSDLIKLNEKINNLIQQNKNSENELISKTSESLTLENEVKKSCDLLSWSMESPLNVWEKALEELMSEQSRLKELENKLLAKEILIETNSLLENYKLLKKIFEDASKEREKAYNGKDVNIEVSQLDKEISQCIKSIEIANSNITKLTAEQKEINTTLLKFNSEILAELKPLGVDNLDELKNKILDENLVKSLRKELQVLAEEEAKLKAIKETLEKDLEEARKKDDQTISLDQLVIELENLKIKCEDLKKIIWENENILKINNENIEKQKLYGEKLNALEKELSVWSLMNSIIGDANGKRFSDFVQDITLTKLIEYGNKRLKGFSDRYMLNNEGKPDTLMVIDTYMGNTKRSVTSLSGGETFMLSLALAFGLSDLAAKNIEIESLFIDEGFGTLDPDSLDQAITILENMQSDSNKSIGIISHVGELKDRIGAKIKLVRTGSGYSTIEIE